MTVKYYIRLEWIPDFDKKTIGNTSCPSSLFAKKEHAAKTLQVGQTGSWVMALSTNIAFLRKKQPLAASMPARFSSRRAYAQTFAATAAIRTLGIVSGVLAARLLGPIGRGELAVIIFLPTLLAPIGELELPRSVAFEASKPGDLPLTLSATSCWLAALLGVIQAIVLAAILPVYLPADKSHLLHDSRWFMLYLPAAYVTAALMGSDQGRGRFGRFSFLMVLPGALYTLFIIAVWSTGRTSPSFFAFSLLIATILTTVVRVGLDGDGSPFRRPDPNLARRLVTRGISYYIPAIAGFVLSRADMLILVRIVPTEAVGLYAVAQGIALGQMGAVLPFVHVGFAAVAREEQPRAALIALARHFRLAQVAAVGMGLFAAALTPWAIRIFFGPRFSSAAGAAYFLIGATAFWGMGLMLEQALRAAEHPRVGIVSNLAGLALLVASGIPACLRFGIDGLAASFMAAEFLNLGILICFCVFWLGMSPSEFSVLHRNGFNELKAIALATATDICQKWKSRPAR